MAEYLIIGASGMLGRELVAACREAGVEAAELPGRAALDVTDAGAVARALGALRPRVVFNAAGFTDVDAAEARPEAADRVNRAGAVNVARACAGTGALLVHFSTDYVFPGRGSRPWRVDDPPGPVNAYGRSKLAGERGVAAVGGEILLVRTAWLFAPHGRNFVRSILEAARGRTEIDVVDDQTGSPTAALDAARAAIRLVERGARGVWHVANSGSCTRYELARAAVTLAGLAGRVRPCPTSRVPRPAARPEYSVLDLGPTEALLGPLRPWSEALAECVEALAPAQPAARAHEAAERSRA